jgi:hypothetical protein
VGEVVGTSRQPQQRFEQVLPAAVLLELRPAAVVCSREQRQQ